MEPLVIIQASELQRLIDDAIAKCMVDIRATIAEAMRPQKEPEQPRDRLMTVDELCKFLGVSRSDWYRKKNKYPELKALNRGRLWMGEKIKDALGALG